MDHPELEAAASLIYGNPATVEKKPPILPSKEPGDLMYGLGGLTDQIDKRSAELWTETGASESDRKHLRNQFLEMAKSGVPPSVVLKVISPYIDGELAAARYRTEEEASADEDDLNRRIAEGNVEVRNRLISTYGSAAEAEALLTRAEKYVRQHPALAKALQRHGLGSVPDIAEEVVAHVFSTGYV